MRLRDAEDIIDRQTRMGGKSLNMIHVAAHQIFTGDYLNTLTHFRRAHRVLKPAII